MKRFLMLLTPMLLAACVGSIENTNVEDISTSESFVVVDVDFRFDNQLTESCFIQPDPSTTKDLDVIAKETYRLRIMRVPHGGPFLLKEVLCIENKIFWNKIRRKELNPPLQVNLEPGTITYPGTIVADWESEGFGLSDVLANGGGFLADDGSLVMKREDRSAAIKALLDQKNPRWTQKFRFVTKSFDPNSNIRQ